MKFTLIVATLALVSGIDLPRNTTAHGTIDYLKIKNNYLIARKNKAQTNKSNPN